jgi:HEAT repeat protein
MVQPTRPTKRTQNVTAPTATARIKKLVRLVTRIAATRNDDARHKITLSLLEFPRETLLEDLKAAYDAVPDARFSYPPVLATLADNKVLGIKEALRPLLLDKNKAVRSNAAEFSRRWADDLIPEFRALIDRHALKDGHGLCEAFSALGAATKEDAFEGLMSVARAEFKYPLWRAAFLKAVARHRRKESKPLFVKAAKAKDPYVRQAGTIGLARLGDRRALDRLVADLDDDDWRIGRIASIMLREMVGTPLVSSPVEAKKLATWWDRHTEVVDARFAKFLAANPRQLRRKR